MARPLRIEYPGAVYHVTARGNARADIYLDEADRASFLDVYAHVSQRFNWRCHAYCLMTNHYHFVIETPEGNLSKGMRQLNGVYTQRFNRANEKTGHIFQGRFTAILVERDAYLLELCRYVVLNPVRAGIVRSAREWPWSSYRAMAGLVAGPSWLTTEWILGQFGQTRKAAELAFREFVSAGRGKESIWEHLQQQMFLGSGAFIARAQERIKDQEDLSEVPRAHRRPPSQSLASYAIRHRSATDAMAAAYASGGYTLKEIANHFGVHYSTVSRTVKTREKS
jgi:REP element-mobilizing transposase RayT